MDVVIETRGLSKTYRRGTAALRAVDLQVPRGACFGLLGPNGAGKSTLVKTLLGIVHASAGSATINGIDFRSPAARQGVGYLPEGHAFPPYLSGRQVCRYFGNLAGLRGPSLEREVDEKLEWVGMSERADERVTDYSKGMKQRIGLAQALVGQPSLVFLDEPTDGLDPIGRAEIRAVIQGVIQRGATVFFNSHLLSEVEVLCDVLAILKQGQVLRTGRTADLVAEMGGEETQLVVRVTCGELPEELWQALAGRGATQDAAGFSLTLAGREHTSELIDELRAAAVPIYAVRPVERTLETAFVELVRGQAAPPAPGDAEPAAPGEAAAEGSA